MVEGQEGLGCDWDSDHDLVWSLAFGVGLL